VRVAALRGYRSGVKSDSIVSAAKQMRREPTPAEKAMWKLLRSRQFGGLKFRRQYPYNSFILDLYCPAHRLAIELDGSQHVTPDGRAQDAERTAQLQGAGIRVLRFSNRDVLYNSQVVLHRLEETIKPGGQ
jgi:very-short-patch-repair endonuclease